ncbi:MAG: uracil-DNA glycosylase family protein [Sphingomonadaceae bacterium]
MTESASSSAPSSAKTLEADVRACTVCAQYLPYAPKPIVQFSATSRLVIIGQAPGIKVQKSGIPWDDASGDRLREWTGLSHKQFYDPAITALMPMGFCYPGKGKSGDLPPRKECAPLWHDKILNCLPKDRLTLLVGVYSQHYYLPDDASLLQTERVHKFRSYLPDFLPLPHPSWRSTIFMRKNPWFEGDVLPALRKRIAGFLG